MLAIPLLPQFPRIIGFLCETLVQRRPPTCERTYINNRAASFDVHVHCRALGLGNNGLLLERKEASRSVVAIWINTILPIRGNELHFSMSVQLQQSFFLFFPPNSYYLLYEWPKDEKVQVTHRIRILDLPHDLQRVPPDHRHHALRMYHITVLCLTQELIVALHDTVEAHAQKVHVLRLHDVAKGILVLRPDDASFDHGLGIIAHSFEGRKGFRSEGCVRVGVGMGPWGAGV